MSLAYVASGASPFIAIIASLTFAITMLWLCASQLIVAQRCMFAWGMDRMGPKWFTSVSSRWASPVGMYLFAFGLSVFLVVGYWYLFPSVLTGVVAGGMQVCSSLLVTAIAAITLVYRKKVAHIWSASPFSRWKVAGIPVLAIGGVVYLCYFLALLYFSFLAPHTRDITGRKGIILIAVWVAGICWYLVWKYISRRKGVDVTHLTYSELHRSESEQSAECWQSRFSDAAGWQLGPARGARSASIIDRRRNWGGGFRQMLPPAVFGSTARSWLAQRESGCHEVKRISTSSLRTGAVDHGPDGIRITSVSPATFDTPMVAREIAEADDPAACAEDWPRYLRSTPCVATGDQMSLPRSSPSWRPTRQAS